MNTTAIAKTTRRPRFRRASEPPAFRLTDDDISIVRQLARYRFLRSTHIAAFLGRSLDRTNDRLSKLYHAGYVDRPRAQLDRFPTGSPHFTYALADRGARLLIEVHGIEFANVEWSRKNRETTRPFIEHQLETIDFWVGLQMATAAATGISLIHQDEIVAAFPDQQRTARNPLALRVRLSHDGRMEEIGIVPDLALGLRFQDSSRRCFVVEIDRGTMPVTRSDLRKTSYQRKMRGYLTAHAAKQHERQFGWKTFRVLTVTTDRKRMSSMQEALRELHVANSPGPSLFYFAVRDELSKVGPMAHTWSDGHGRETHLV